jgi:hypothetical protein
VGGHGHAYLQFMTYRNASPIAGMKTIQLHCTAAVNASTVTTLVKSGLRATLAVLALATISMAAELPEAPSSVIRTNGAMIEVAAPAHSPRLITVSPEIKLVDKKFFSMVLISSGSTFADSYTTLFARQNWLAGKKGVCNEEVESAYLYGTHPTVARTYAVASVKSVSSALAAYYLRKHHTRFWSLPLLANSVMSLQGVSQNMAACN